MVRQRKKEIVTMKIRVNVGQRDIDEGECLKPHRCMHKLAVARALKDQLRLKDTDQLHKLHVKVDAAHIRFNYAGHRWKADTPRVAENMMILFDKPKTRDQVKPHGYTIHAVRGAKVEKFTRARQDQINEARRKRIARGKPDRPYMEPTLHERVVGHYLTQHR